jgi:hypothetical protein
LFRAANQIIKAVLVFAFRPLSGSKKEKNPLRPLRLCGEIFFIFSSNTFGK